jgi:hypothetical protein
MLTRLSLCTADLFVILSERPPLKGDVERNLPGGNINRKGSIWAPLAPLLVKLKEMGNHNCNAQASYIAKSVKFLLAMCMGEMREGSYTTTASSTRKNQTATMYFVSQSRHSAYEPGYRLFGSSSDLLQLRPLQ